MASLQPVPDPIRHRTLAYIGSCTDLVKLRNIIANAGKAGDAEVQRAARLRLYAVSPAEAPGTLEHDVWQSIFALEDALSNENRKTTRLSRTRQKIGRDGEHKTVTDLILGKPSAGFAMLVQRNMIERTFEAVALRFADRFHDDTLAKARERLANPGAVDPTGKDNDGTDECK